MSKMSRIRRAVPAALLASAVVLATPAPATAGPPEYRVEILPIARALDISDSGIIVGSDQGNAVVLRNGSITRLPPLAGDVSSEATAVNDRGEVAGTSTDASGVFRAVIWRGGEAVALGSLGLPRSSVAAINNRGHVTGFADVLDATGRPTTHAYFWDGEMHDLGTLPGQNQSVPFDMNDRDQIVGFSGFHAVRWEADGTATDLGTLAWRNAIAQGINNRGQVVGVGLSAVGPPHAFVWTRGSYTDLGTLGGFTSSASRINDDGLVAGQAGTADNQTHAVVWDDGRAIDLHPVGASFSIAGAVNNRGDVLGSIGTATGLAAVVWRR